MDKIELTIYEKQPIANWQWINVADICSNNYNPNVVMNQELELLKYSLLNPGWIQPLLLNQNSAPLADAKKNGSFSDQSGEQTGHTAEKDPEESKASVPQKKYTLIDGFHRFYLSTTDKDVIAAYKGFVPAIPFVMSEPECMLLTVRINRAKGVHVAVKMHELVTAVFNQYGYTKQEIAKQIGADIAEIDLLLQENVFSKLNIPQHKYSKAWIPK